MTWQEAEVLFPHICPDGRLGDGRLRMTPPTPGRHQCAICEYLRVRGIRLDDLELLARAQRAGRLAS